MKKEDEESLFRDEMESEDDFDSVDFQTALPEIASLYNEERVFKEPTFDNLEANKFVLVNIIRIPKALCLRFDDQLSCCK